MDFLIADTFTASLARLKGDEQKAVKTTAFDLQLNPAAPGFQFHRLEKARDKNFWSVRVNRDLRIIVHKTSASLLLCYVDHHDRAYDWAERRKLERHPSTGAVQMVEIRETIRNMWTPSPQPAPLTRQPQKRIFADLTAEALLGYGVPQEWLTDVMTADEDSFVAISAHLPAEATEALLQLATGGTPAVQGTVSEEHDPYTHPDSQRRFRLVTSVAELQLALDFPWEKWTVFLHPSQRSIVERRFNGPARVSGSAGTGKTIVALHRAVTLARRNPGTRVLLTTFSEMLAASLRQKLKLLTTGEPHIQETIHVECLFAVARQITTQTATPEAILPDSTISDWLADSGSSDTAFSTRFLFNEWLDVVDAWQIESWDAYRSVNRLGRKTRLTEKSRATLWKIFEQIIGRLKQEGRVTKSGLFSKATQIITESDQSPYQFVVVDEAQDTGIPEMRFLAALGRGKSESLFFSGDPGQRIFQTPFSWKSLGIDIRGRSHTLRINYRTSQQIRQSADRLLPLELTDVDGNTESRRGTISVFSGPKPLIQVFDDVEAEIVGVAAWIRERIAEGFLPNELAIIVRSDKQIQRARMAMKSAWNVGESADVISICTMHGSKGLEFRGVVVMACDDEVAPLQERLELITDDSDLQEVYETERHLLYVACTRARDQLYVTGVNPASEFLDDLKDRKN